MADTALIGGALAIFALAAAGIAALLRLARRQWSGRRVALIAASVLPLLLLALCAWVFLAAYTSGPEHCGVDACGMAMLSALSLALIAPVGFVAGIAGAMAVMRLMPRR